MSSRNELFKRPRRLFRNRCSDTDSKSDKCECPWIRDWRALYQGAEVQSLGENRPIGERERGQAA